MVGDNGKRRSLLFPFRPSPPKQESKFEVINRKKSPLHQAQSPNPHQNTTNAPLPVPTTPASVKKPMVNNAPPPSTSTSTTRSISKSTQGPRQAQAHSTLDPKARQSPANHSQIHHHNQEIQEQQQQRSLSPQPAAKYHKHRTKDSINLGDFPVANLNINGDLPPVPDYNSFSFAPPVTIKGREVSLARKQPPPKRKPPSEATSDDESIARSIPSRNVTPVIHETTTEGHQVQPQVQPPHQDYYTSSMLSPEYPVMTGASISPSSSHDYSTPENFNKTLFQEAHDKNKQNLPEINIEEVQDKPIVFKKTQDLDPIRTESGPWKSSSVDIHDATLTKTSTKLPGAFPSLTDVDVTYKPASLNNSTSTASNVSNNGSGQQQSEQRRDFGGNSGLTEPQKPFQQPPRVTDSRHHSLTSQEFFDADESFDESSLEFKNEEEVIRLERSEQFQLADPPSKSLENARFCDDDDDDDDDDVDSDSSDQSSIEVKPLNFHRKTQSVGAPQGISQLKDKEKGHIKQLSLSDEIMRDIENFQPGVITQNLNRHEFAEGDVSSDEEISPITPLKTPNLIQKEVSRDAQTINSNQGEQDNEGDFSFEKSLTVANIRPGGNSLFNDSSDDNDDEMARPSFTNENSHDTPRGIPTPPLGLHNAIDELRHSDSSKSSSLNPEINYEPSPDAEDDTRTQNALAADPFEETEQSLQVPGSTIVRSPSITNLHKDMDSSAFSSKQHSRTSSFEPSASTKSNDRYFQGSGINEEGSPYSYQQSPERRTFRIVNDSEDNEEDESPLNEQESGRYAGQTTRTFHVVNDGNYSDSDEVSYDLNGEDRINTSSLVPNGNYDYSVVHQEDLIPQIDRRMSDQVDDESSNEVLSFTAKSPKVSEFSFGSSPRKMFSGANPSGEFSEDVIQRSITPIQPLSSSEQTSPLKSSITTEDTNSSGQPIAAPSSHLNVYDRRGEETIAPVQYLNPYHGKSRRPPPDLSTATRSGRSASISSPLPNNYNSIQEDTKETTTVPHEPERSGYVEMLRLGAGTTNSNIASSKWGLPIGIAEIDHSKFISSASRAAYRRSLRSHKNDLKHGKIKQRQLALEVGDDGDDDSVPGLNERRESTELKRFETDVSLGSANTTPSMTPGNLGSPTQSFGSFSPRKDPPMVNRSGTLITDKITPQQILGRSGTVHEAQPVKNMTLFIANPDVDDD